MLHLMWVVGNSFGDGHVGVDMLTSHTDFMDKSTFQETSQPPIAS